MKYESRQELAKKIEWEGGIADFFLGYGMRESDLPDNDPELARLVKEILPKAIELDSLFDELYELFEDSGDAI